MDEKQKELLENLLQLAEQGEQPKPPDRPVLYMFQFRTLPEAAFQKHPELMRELDQPVEAAALPPGMPSTTLLHIRSKARIQAEQCGLVELKIPSEEDMEAEMLMYSGLRIHRFQQHGQTMHVIEMPSPKSPPEAYFAAIVNHDNESREHMVPAPAT